MADTQLAETLFTAMDKIIYKRIEELPYDKTILATIENIDNAKNGEYIVNDGQTTFKAYSTNTEYSKDDRVYVNIPQGDYKEQKNIIGKYNLSNTNQIPLNYKDPMESLIDMTGNLFYSDKDDFKLIANGTKKDSGIIWSWIADDDDEDPFADFTMLGISAGFRSSVGANRVISEGQYGLKLTVISKQNGNQNESDNSIGYVFYLNSEEFFGDPYNFEVFYKQSKVIDLRQYGIDRIDAMTLSFYQSDNFLDANRKRITPKVIGYDLAVNEINIKIGYNIADYQDKDDTVIIHTIDPKTYIGSISSNIKRKYADRNIESMDQSQIVDFLNEINEKKIVCRWIHKVSENNFICYSENTPIDKLPDGMEIQWYRYKYEELKDDNNIIYSNPPGTFWEEETEYRNSFTYYMTPVYTKHTEKVKVVLWSPSQQYVEEYIIENDNNYVDQTSYTQACLNVLVMLNPFYFCHLINDNEYYKGFLRWQGMINASENVFLNTNNINENTFLSQQKYKIVNQWYEDKLASSNAEDIYRICSIIKGQVNYLIYFLENKSYYTYLDRSFFVTNGATLEEKIAEGQQLLKEFYNEYYLWLDSRDIMVDLQAHNEVYVSKWLEFLQNKDLSQYSINIRAYDQDPANAYHNIVTYLNTILTECNKTASTRDYNKIKDDFKNLINKVNTYEGQLFNYYSDLSNITTNGAVTSNKLLQYNCVKNYNEFLNIYDEKERERKAINYSLKAEAAFFESNELEFLNEDPNAWEEFDTIHNLVLEVDKAGQNGVYKFYTGDGFLTNDVEAQTLRLITAKYVNVYTGQEELDTAEEIIWRFPRSMSMIVKPEEEIEYSLYDKVNWQDFNSTIFANGTYYRYNSAESKYEIATTYSSSEIYYVRNSVQFWVDTARDCYCISRKMPVKNKNKTYYGQEEAASTEIYFRIRNYYMPELMNNKISCTIVRNNKPVTAEASLLFGTQDLNGTDYNFVLQFANNSPFVIFRGDPVPVTAKVFDQDGIEKDVETITYSWYSQGNGGLSLDSSNGTIIPDKNCDDIQKCAHYILKASVNTTVTVGGTEPRLMEISAYLPVIVVKKTIAYSWNANNSVIPPIKAGSGDWPIYRYDGRSSVVYDNSGTNPSYYKDPFNIYILDTINKDVRLVENTTWGTIHTSACERTFTQNNQTVTTFEQRYFPNIDSEHRLVVPQLYMNHNANETVSLTCSLNNEIVFVMPLHVYHQVYSSAYINQWDGELTIDEKNDIIMATMVGAGFKDDQNKFNGILMGYNKDEANQNNLYYNGTGLYGYNAGVKSFGFNINGYGFIGKTGRGQILFDGNNGVIESANYSSSVGGMHINVDEGIIDILGKSPSQSSVFISPGLQGTNRVPFFRVQAAPTHTLINIDANPISNNRADSTYFLKSYSLDDDLQGYGMYLSLSSGVFQTTSEVSNGKHSLVYIAPTEPYFRIDSTNSNTLMYIGNSIYYLKSDNYVTQGNSDAFTGMYINLTSGIIDIRSPYSNGKQSQVHISSGDPYFYVKTDKNTTNDDNPYLICVGASAGYFLKSVNYSTDNKTGCVIDLNNGDIVTYNGLIYGGELRIGDNFYVDSYGNLTATNGEFHGSIYATSGEIGSWTLTDGKLIGGSCILDGSGNTSGDIGGNARSDFVIYCGNFGVASDGTMYGVNAEIIGTIKGIDVTALNAYRITQTSWWDNSTPITYTVLNLTDSTSTPTISGAAANELTLRIANDSYINAVYIPAILVAHNAVRTGQVLVDCQFNAHSLYGLGLAYGGSDETCLVADGDGELIWFPDAEFQAEKRAELKRDLEAEIAALEDRIDSLSWRIGSLGG